MPNQEGSYLAEPSGPGRGGVLVVHDWYGLLPHVRTLCDELAAAGLVAIAPDLYDGRTASDPEQAEALMEAMDGAKAGAKLDAAIADLRERGGGGPVGGLGFSMGGFRVLLRATTGAFDAVAVYYAALDEEQATSIHCPVLLHLTERDEFDPPEVFEQFVTGLRAAGTPVEARTWPGTEHSFANADVALYAPTQAAEAWSITVRFLRHHLGSP
ncbi:MAG: dienelactone hydrolase family protein [Actinomycetes bacterium]|jgi:carboxymethylenebutenolidase